MTQPPDDAALVARLREEALQLHSTAWSRMDGGQDCSISAALAEEAATALEAKDRQIEVLESALVDLMSWFPAKPSPPEWRLLGGERGADDAVEAARAALEPSDKGVGR